MTTLRPRRLNEHELATGSWLRLVEIEYAGHDGRVRTWEAASRLHQRGAVVVIARFVPGGDYLLVQQYRPPADAFILEDDIHLFCRKISNAVRIFIVPEA